MRGLKICGALVLGFFLSLLTGCSGGSIDWANAGAPAGTGFLTKSFTFESQPQNYTVFIPHDFKAGNHYPVIVFLHGVLESGSNGRKCVTVGLGPAVNDRAGNFQFIAVFPQSSSDWEGDTHGRLALATLDQVLKDYPAADPDRVILTGLSNGGDGTWLIGAAHPERFAALAPMCSGVNYDDAPKLTKLPIWCFHNSVDPFRSSGRAEEMCNRIKAAGGNVKFTKYSELGHDCWTRAFSEGEVFQWMLEQHRTGAKTANAQ
jgi:predicted peptidase